MYVWEPGRGGLSQSQIKSILGKNGICAEQAQTSSRPLSLRQHSLTTTCLALPRVRNHPGMTYSRQGDAHRLCANTTPSDRRERSTRKLPIRDPGADRPISSERRLWNTGCTTGSVADNACPVCGLAPMHSLKHIAVELLLPVAQELADHLPTEALAL